MRASPTDILARKSARVGQVGGQVVKDRRACPREDPRAEVGEDVRVGVGPMEFQLNECGKALSFLRDDEGKPHSVYRGIGELLISQ